jgi:hypothetical protein
MEIEKVFLEFGEKTNCGKIIHLKTRRKGEREKGRPLEGEQGTNKAVVSKLEETCMS